MYDGMDVWEISVDQLCRCNSLDLFYRCQAIEEQWFKRQLDPLSDYQVAQCDTLMLKITSAILQSADDMQDMLYRRLGDFQEEMLNGGNRRDIEVAE